jgi:hypothetical protein
VKYTKNWLFVILFVMHPFSFLFSQIFPLKQDISGKYFNTREKKPFLINAYPAGEFFNTEEVVRNITRLSYQGINTIYVRLLTNESRFDENGKPQRTERKKNIALKRLIREAAIKNMLVLIHPETNAPGKEGNRGLYLRYYSAKLKHFKHVAWILSESDFQDEKLISLFSSRQLKGLVINDSTAFNHHNFDFAVLSGTSRNSNFSKPTVLLINTNCPPENSAAFIRTQAYTAILEGNCGTIVNAPVDLSFSVVNPVTGNLRQMKAVFDTLGWHHWQANRAVFSSGSRHEMRYISVINNHLSQIVIYNPSGTPLHLNFDIFNPSNKKIKFTWINPVTGITFIGYTNYLPSNQIYLPPYMEGNTSDWLLLIEPLKLPGQE